MNTRRDFLKKTALFGASMVTAPSLMAGDGEADLSLFSGQERLNTASTVENTLRISGTFLDEISHDIPHQNWGEKEWEQDFRHMRAIGIDTVIMIRSGYRKFITYPSMHLLGKGCYYPSIDLLDMFLRLADKYSMKFYFGLYDSGRYWDTGDLSWEIEDNKYVIDEVWQNYGSKYKSFGGWYISGEISRATKGAIDAFHAMGKQCKDVSGGLPTFISPWIDGKKAVMANGSSLTKADAVSVDEHEREWNEIFDGIHDVVDACAFQDGHIDYDELDAFFAVNKKLADKYGITQTQGIGKFNPFLSVTSKNQVIISIDRLLLVQVLSQNVGSLFQFIKHIIVNTFLAIVLGGYVSRSSFKIRDIPKKIRHANSAISHCNTGHLIKIGISWILSCQFLDDLQVF